MRRPETLAELGKSPRLLCPVSLPCPRCAPDAWCAAIRAAILRAGSLRGAARALGVSARELGRWLARDPELAKGVVIRAPGRPRRHG